MEIATNLEVEPVICSENDYDLLFNAIYGRGGEQQKDLFGDLAEEDGDITTTLAGGEEREDIAIDTLQDQASQAPVIRMPTTAASATLEWATRADSISAVPRRCPLTLITSSSRPIIQK